MTTFNLKHKHHLLVNLILFLCVVPSAPNSHATWVITIYDPTKPLFFLLRSYSPKSSFPSFLFIRRSGVSKPAYAHSEYVLSQTLPKDGHPRRDYKIHQKLLLLRPDSNNRTLIDQLCRKQTTDWQTNHQVIILEHRVFKPAFEVDWVLLLDRPTYQNYIGLYPFVILIHEGGFFFFILQHIHTRIFPTAVTRV